MTKTEALKMLDGVELSNKPSRVNNGLTIRQCVDIVRKAVLAGPETLTDLIEKRIYQVCRNQRRPRY